MKSDQDYATLLFSRTSTKKVPVMMLSVQQMICISLKS